MKRITKLLKEKLLDIILYMKDLKIRMNFKQNEYYVSVFVLGTILYKSKINLIFFVGSLCFLCLAACRTCLCCNSKVQKIFTKHLFITAKYQK